MILLLGHKHFEFIRGSILTGFPWNLIAYSFVNHLEILSITSLIGTYGFNLFCISLFASPAIFIMRESKKDIGVCVIFLILPFLFYLYGISIATVYRTVKLFEESGILAKHEFKGGKARYEGNLGALASKPVMEGKAVLFKRFADIDSIDLEIDSSDAEEIINSIKNFAPSFGGINLEDIAAPDCFIIEQKLKEILDIPVFHDDQHGTAIITTAALINALDISGKSIKEIKVVVNGAGASAQACTELFKNSGVKSENIIMLDKKGVIYKGRSGGIDQWKSRYANETKLRILEEAINGADVFLGLSAKGALKKEHVKTMAKNPIIFACANPDPEITPEEINDVSSY